MKTYINKIYQIFIMLIFIVSIIGCEEFEIGDKFLEQPPELDFTKDSAFVNAQRARQVLWNAYSTLPKMHPDLNSPNVRAPLSVLTDLAGYGENFSGGILTWIRGEYNATNNTDWKPRTMWKGLRTAHIFLENVDDVPDMSTDEKILLKAEAKMIMATHYYEFFRNYGGILYVDRAYKPTDETDIERLTIMESVDKITELLNEGIAVLPFELDDPETWEGRFTSAAALAIKVKLLTFAASPLFNSDEPYMPESHEAVAKKLVWTGGYQRNLWERAKEACETLISKIEAGSGYGLVNTGNPQADYRNGYFYRGTGETLLSIRHFYLMNQPNSAHYGWLRPNWNGFNVPLHNYVRKFPMANGKSIDNPESGYDPENPYAGRDPRLYEVIKVLGGLHNGRKIELWEGGRERKNMRDDTEFAGYRFRKWWLDGNRPFGEVMHSPEIRVPDIYLTYAEILNELNNGPTDKAFEYVNKIRDRAQVGPIEEFIGKSREQITKQEFLDALLNERALELGVERQRWYDMVRYKLEDVFTTPNFAMDITLNDAAKEIDKFNDFFQKNVDYSDHHLYFNFEINETDKGKVFWQDKSNFSPKFYLLAFPQEEIQKNYGLIQNPGWETTNPTGN